MKVRNTIVALTALLAIAGSTLMASAQNTNMGPNGGIALYPGAQMNGRLRRDLNTGKSEVGDRFMMDVVEPYPNNDQRYAGAIVTGEVSSVTSAGQGRKPSIGLQFDTLEFADGTTVNITATMTADQRVQKKKSGARVLLDTIGGMLLGNAIGQTVFHTGGGGIAGAAGGFLYGQNDQADFDLPRGSDVQLTIEQPVNTRRQSGGEPPQQGMQQDQPPQQQENGQLTQPGPTQPPDGSTPPPDDNSSSGSSAA